MTVFTPKNPDFDAIYPLWNEAFGDSRTTAKRYFDAILPHSTLFLIMDENIPVSMLFSVEEQVLHHKISYIYAVATAKTHRGQGLATALLSFAEEASRNSGHAACLLCPATPELGTFYARFGYQTWSQRDFLQGPENQVPASIRTLHTAATPTFAMAKIFRPDFPSAGTFRYPMD